MSIDAKLYFDTSVLGCDLIAFDNGEIQCRAFPFVDPGTPDLSLAADKTDPRNASRHIRNVVVDIYITRIGVG